jgi:hypothetical protein
VETDREYRWFLHGPANLRKSDLITYNQITQINQSTQIEVQVENVI